MSSYRDLAKRRATARARYARDPKKFIKKTLDSPHHSRGWRGRRTALIAEQGGRCAACGGDDPRSTNGWAMDHNHATGKIRGVLCHSCNVSLGLMRESVDAIIGLALYLERHR